MPRPVGEPGPRGAEAEARRKGKKPPRPAVTTPKSAKTPEGARKYAESQVVEEVKPSGKRTYGPAAGTHPSPGTKVFKRWPSIVAHLEGQREKSFLSYRKQALESVATKHLKFNEDGEVETKKIKVPEFKTSPLAVKKATEKLNKVLSEAKKDGADPKRIEVAKAIGSRRIAKANYRLDKNGNIQFSEVTVPKLRTSPKALQKDLKRVNRVGHEIREGSRDWNPPDRSDEDEDRPILGDLIAGGTGAVGNAVDNLGKITVPVGPPGSTTATADIKKGFPELKNATGDVVKAFMAGARAQQTQQDMQLEAMGLGFIPEVRSKALHGIRTGVLFGTEYLTRPGLAVEAMIAEGLSSPTSPLGRAVLSEKGRKELAKGAGPGEALLHGHGGKNVISGGELGKALFGMPQLGLPIDILTDPFMYIGFAGLPAKFAERSAAITSRIAENAPNALKDIQFTRLISAAHKSGDYEQVTKYLEGVAKKNGVSLRKLGKSKADKAAIAEVNRATTERAREIADLIEEGRINSPTIKGKSIHVPGEAAQRAAEEIAKFGLRRSLKPGFTLELRTPLGRKLGGIEVPVPKKLASARVVPRFTAIPAALGREPESSKILEMARNSNAEARVYREFADEHETLLNKLSELEAKPTSTRTEIHAAETELADFEDTIRARMMDARTKEAGRSSMASMNEVMRGYNAKRFAHEIYRSTNALGRQTQRQFFHNVMQAVDPIRTDRAARLRVGAHMSLQADVGSRKLLENVAPLAPKEQKVLDDLNKVYKELERYGFETGTLKRAVENYLPRYWTTADDIAGPLHAGPRSEEILPLGGKRGANSAFQQHRTMAEMAAIADKQKLAKMIRTVATKPITTKQSLDLAEDWFRKSKIRFAMEDMAQAVQRGQLLKEGDLTELQKAAYEWSQNMVSQSQDVPALFQSLEKTEGVLKLQPQGARYHSLPEEPFNGLTPWQEYRVKLSSALESEQAIINVMQDAKVGSPLHNHYREILTQRKKEVADLIKTKPEREAPDRAITPVNDGAEAPTAEMVGLATDREIEGFLPNATEEYIGTLKDFRRDHPDKFPVLDPLLANYHRTRAEGLQTVYRTRWRAIDKAVGRSTEEARASRYVLADGRSGYTSELKPVFPDEPLDPNLPNDKPIAYEFRESGEKIDPEDIEFPGRTLIPNREYRIWYDPSTGREYAEAPNIDPSVGTAIKDAVGPDRLWPTDVIRDARAEFFRMGETGMTDLYDSGLENLAQRALTMVRYGVTTLFPAFHVRNMISDTFLSMLADPGMLFHPVSNAKMTWSVLNRGGKVKVKDGVKFGIDYVDVPGLGKLKPEDYLAVMDTFGLRSNQHIAEMARLAERGDVPELEKWWQGVHSYRRPVQVVKGGFGFGPTGMVGRRAVEASARREDIARIITFTQRMRRNKGDFADAMWWTIKHHFDYGDLTTFERRWMRNLFLFYTWYRKNLPLQFMSIITRPGFFSGMTNAYIDLAEGETPLNFNWSKINPILPDMSGPVPNSGLVPDYMFNQLAATSTNWNGHALAVGFGAPWADMNLITHLFENPEESARQWLGLLNPGVSVPFQFSFRKDLLTGREFDKREKSGAASMLSWLGSKFGFDPTMKDDEGNPVLPWQLNLAFNQLPIGGRLSGYFRQAPMTEDPGRINKWFGGGVGSFFTGLNAYMSPASGERLDAAYISRVIGRAAQRSELSKQGGTEKDLAEFDRQTLEWAKQLGIPHKYLEVVPGIGPAYVTQDERQGFRLGSSGSPLTGGSPGDLKSLLGGDGYGLGGLETDTKPKEYKSQTEESVDKLLHPGQFEEERSLQPLGSSVVPLGGADASNPLETGAGVAGKDKLNEALGRLRANKAARSGEVPPKGKGEDKTLGPPVKAGAKFLRQHTKAKAHNDKTVRKEKLKQRHQTRQKFSKQLRQLRNKVNEGKLPQFEGFTDKDQEQFAQWLTVYSGLPPELVGPWVLAEGGGWGSEGVSGGEAGKNNWLGVGYPGEQTELSRYHKLNEDPKTAAKFTADWLHGKGLPDGSWKAEARIPEIVKLKDRSPQEIEQFIAEESGWGTGHFELGTVAVKGYGGKKNPQAEARLKKVEAAAKKAGFDPAELGHTSLRLQKTLQAKKFKGAWAGSGAVLKPAIRGFEVSSEKRSPTDELSIENPGSDHNEANKEAFAYDLPTSDGEPIAHTVAERLGIKGYHTGDYTSWVSPKYPGYRFQILWAVSGHYDHVHVGAKWTGEDLPKGTYLGGPSGTVSSGGAGAPASGGGSGTTPGYHPGKSQQMEQSVKKMKKRIGAAGGSSTSLPGGAFLTVDEAYNLGSGASVALPESDAIRALKRMEERGTYPGTKVKLPKFKRK